ncbi:MAG: transglycosylase domain-containing protein [Spirochaetaceae bacterium]|nr:transglycosylase domain-containing protein [Spirochaetaceae bacterium]
MKKTIIKIVSIFFIFCFIIYISLNIYCNIKAAKIDINVVRSETKVELSDMQIEIASFIYSKHANPKFTKLPLIIDFFSSKNQGAYTFVQVYGSTSSHLSCWHCLSPIQKRIKAFCTSRYVVRKIDYKTCYNYIFSASYFGYGSIYGLEDASIFYFKKDFKDLSCKEFINLVLISENPYKYDILKEENCQLINDEINEIYSNFKKSQKK